MARHSKPIRVFYSVLSQRFYATCAYHIEPNGCVTVTGEQFDVTNDIGGAIERHGITFKRADMQAEGDQAAKQGTAEPTGRTVTKDDALEGDRDRLRNALSNLVAGLDDLMTESSGVAGLHRNGDVADWAELSAPGNPWLGECLERAREELGGDRDNNA